MTGLREPPKNERPSRIFARLVVLVILLAVVAVIVWTATTNQRIELTEDVALDALELETWEEVDGLQVNVVGETSGVIPVILLHDYDITGSPMLRDVAEQVGGRWNPVLVDLPGYGFSSRIPDIDPAHTVTSMARVVMTVIEDRYTTTPVIVGVGLGGKVAAEIAVVNPDLVRGIVMVDVDFWPERTWERWLQGLPYIGQAVTYTFEGGGYFGTDYWAPRCAEGGWCPPADLAAFRDQALEIRNTTSSLNSFLETPVNSLVPSDLDLIEVPAAYVWSSDGVVPRENVDRVVDVLAGLELIVVDAWKVHLEDPARVAEAIDLVGR